ncbi:hypothetical protein AABB24_036236, partial [Solanum stoloniferum]
FTKKTTTAAVKRSNKKKKSTAPRSSSCPPAPVVQRQPDPTPAFSLLLHVNWTAAGEGQDAAASPDVPNVKTGKSHSLPLPKSHPPSSFHSGFMGFPLKFCANGQIFKLG